MARMSRRAFARGTGLIVLVILAFGSSPVTSGAEPEPQKVASIASIMPQSGGVLQPKSPAGLARAPELSQAEYDAMLVKHEQKKEASAFMTPYEAGPAEIPAPPAEESTLTPESSFHGTPGAFLVGKNVENTRADESTCGTGSTLAEPAAANEGRNILYTGNLRHREFSTNGGTTWTCANAYPAGPAQAPTPFGDTDVVYDAARGVTFQSVLYVNANVTNGIIRIFVRRNMNLNDNCSYDLDLSTATELPDYPHLGLSNDWLYLNANRLGTSWNGAWMGRLSLDPMADCIGVPFQAVNLTGPVGQRILTPGQGADNVMYFAWVENSTQVRMFSWADPVGSPVTQNILGISTVTFANAVCKGGTNNADWADLLTTHVVGFSNRTAIGNDFVSYWMGVANDASHPQAYVRGGVWRIGAVNNSYSLQQQPEIWNSSTCAGMPSVMTNDRGDIGLALAWGGNKTGGTSVPAVQTVISMRDQYSPGPGGFPLVGTGAGTHNPTRYGDYFTVRRNSPCGFFFDATGYAFSGGTGLANINAKYVEFGRGRDNQCYQAWKNAIPAT